MTLADGSFRPGLKTTQWLAAAGITHLRQVGRLGVAETCVLLKRLGYPVTLNLAYGLQAALLGTTWNRLPPEVAAAVREEYRRACDRRGADQQQTDPP